MLTRRNVDFLGSVKDITHILNKNPQILYQNPKLFEIQFMDFIYDYM